MLQSFTCYQQSKLIQCDLENNPVEIKFSMVEFIGWVVLSEQHVLGYHDVKCHGT